MHGVSRSRASLSVFPSAVDLLLEQYADARARLAEAEGYGQGVFGAGSYLSLGQSDVFYDCEQGSDDGSGGGGARSDRHASMKFRVRMAGLDFTLLLAEESVGPLGCGSARASYVRFQMRHMSQTLLCAGRWMQGVAEVGTFVAEWNDGNLPDGQGVRIVEVLGSADASPSVQITCNTGEESRGKIDQIDGEEVTINIDCLEVAVVLDPGLVTSLSKFLALLRQQMRPTQPVACTDHSGRNDQGMVMPSSTSARNPRVVVALALPGLTVRAPADAGACSSDAFAALMSSVQNGTSPVGWTRREASAEDKAPTIVLEVADVMMRAAFGSSIPPEIVLESTRVACQMLLVCGGGARENGGLIGLYLLEASCSSDEAPLKVECSLAKDVRKVGRLDLPRPGDADLNFLHTWEPNDG